MTTDNVCACCEAPAPRGDTLVTHDQEGVSVCEECFAESAVCQAQWSPDCESKNPGGPWLLREDMTGVYAPNDRNPWRDALCRACKTRDNDVLHLDAT